MFKSAVGCSPSAPPDHTLFAVTDAVWRVLVNWQTTTSPAATLNPFVESYENPVPFLVHTADPAVHPALNDDSDTKYAGPVTTLCAPVEPSASPDTNGTRPTSRHPSVSI